MKNRFPLIALAVCLLAFTAAPAAAQSVSASELSEDVRQWRQWMFATHPAPQHTMNIAEIEAAFEQLADPDQESYSRSEAWLTLAQLNRHFGDAHVGLRLPDADYAQALERGAKPFPVAVTVTDGHVFLTGDAATEIVSINDVPATELVEALAPRMRGESRRLQEHVLSLRFPIAIWAMLGDQPDYTVKLRTPDGQVTTRLLNDAGFPSSRPRDDFKLSFAGKTAILTVNTYDRDLEASFAEFLESAFAEISNNGAQRLLIDLRSNGGGARQLSDRLMAYLTTTKYTPISAVSARITAENQSLIPGSKLGQVIETPFAQWVTPPANLDHRFTGDVAILIGPATYSQAIAFAVTAQDFQIASLLGAATEGAANQTGQVQRHTLGNTGFEVQAPLYVFTRPSGATEVAPLTPDVYLGGEGDAQLKAAINSDWRIDTSN